MAVGYMFLTQQNIYESAANTTPSELLLYVLISFILLEHFFEIYLSIRQIRVYTTAVVIPVEIEKITNPIFYHIARVWGMDREYYVLFKTLIFTIFLGCIELIFGLVPFIWYTAVTLADAWKWNSKHEMLVGYMFAFILVIYVTMRKLPLKVAQTYIIQSRYTRQIPSPLYFAALQCVQLVGNLLLVGILVAFIVFVVEYGGKFFYLYLWVTSLLLMLAVLIIYPICIAPILDTYVKLEDGSMKREIEELAKTVKFPASRIFIVQSSKQSDHSNAYFYGVWCVKRIIIHESLLPPEARPKSKNPQQEQQGAEFAAMAALSYTNREVLAIVAHELGHWKKNHVIYGLILMQLGLLLLYVIFGFAFKFKLLYEAVGFKPGDCPIIPGFLIVIVYVLSPVRAVFTLISRTIMRRFEYQADQFSVNLGYADGLRSGLIKIYQLNFSFPVFDKCYACYYHTHPTLLERLNKLN